MTYVLLLQYKEDAVQRGQKVLEMPPVKRAWEVGDAAKSHVLSADDEIAMWEESDSTYVFTDITYGLRHRVGYFLSQ